MNYEEYNKIESDYYRGFERYNRIKLKLFRAMFRYYHRLEVSGPENIPDGPAIIAPNHTGGLDLDLLAISNFSHPERKIVPMITHPWHFINSIWGRYWVGAGLPLWQTGGLRYDYLDQHLQKGGGHYPGLICIYPEGNIQPIWRKYVIGQFFPGVVRIALKYKIPVVPTAMIGFQEACPVFWVIHYPKAPDDVLCPIFSLPFKLKVEFGKPIYLDKYYGRNLSKPEEFWLANEVIKPRLVDLIGKHAKASTAPVDAEMREPS